MSEAPCRLTVVLTHPVQYYAPWFRHIAANCPAIDLTVVYAAEPTPEQQGVGFGKPFQWDVPLREGYKSRVVRAIRPSESVHSGRFWGLNVGEIGRAIAETDPEVAMIYGWYSVTLLRALIACRLRGIPTLYRGDTHFVNAPAGWKRAAWSLKSRALLRQFDGYLSVGTATRDYLIRMDAKPGRIFDAPHCVDNAFFAASAAPHQTPEARAAARAALGAAPEDFAVLFVGKFEPIKRPLDLIRAAARLGGNARLLLAGAGELEPDCRAEAERLGVRASWLGFLNQSDLGRAYAAADCLAIVSRSETWGLVANEAMATGLPCVVSDRVGCAPDLIVPGATGEAYPMGDVDALAAALERVRAGRAGGHDFAPACRRRIEACSFAAATAGLERACAALRRPAPSLSRASAAAR